MLAVILYRIVPKLQACVIAPQVTRQTHQDGATQEEKDASQGKVGF